MGSKVRIGVSAREPVPQLAIDRVHLLERELAHIAPSFTIENLVIEHRVGCAPLEPLPFARCDDAARFVWSVLRGFEF